jgi:Eukaryotic translation initiation factor eIF2A
MEESIPSEQVALSPDKSLLAVQEQLPMSGRVHIYRLEPFARVRSLDEASLDYQLQVPSEIWSRNNNQLLAQMGPCGDSQRLMLFDLAVNVQQEIAVGRVMRFVLSPDAELIAYTSFGRFGHVASADRSMPGVLVSDDVAAPIAPRWSKDSRYVAFYFIRWRLRLLRMTPPDGLPVIAPAWAPDGSSFAILWGRDSISLRLCGASSLNACRSRQRDTLQDVHGLCPCNPWRP